MCFSLFELSILNLLHKASKLIPEPGNLFLARSNVSTVFSLFIPCLPAIDNSLFKCEISNSALCIIIFLSLILFLKNLIKKIIPTKEKILLKVNIKIWMKNNAC